MNRVTLSVVVISWNQLSLLQRLVEQLRLQDFANDRYEIVIVDDGSTDGSREWLRKQQADNLRVIFGSGNHGRGASRNEGILAARCDVIVMVDGDHTIQPDFLAVHAECHERERCVIVGKSDFADLTDVRALNSYLNNGGAAKLPSHSRLPGRYFLTRNCSVPRDLLIEVGLFDERFQAWGGEDLDLGMRLERSGVPLYGEPRALAVHHHHRGLSELMAQLYIYGRDCIPILLERHPQLFYDLNLDLALTLKTLPSRHSVILRGFVRLLMSSPCYNLVLMIAQSFRRQQLPRALFDYLHLRQYTKGYMESLRRSERKHRYGNAD